MEQGPGKIAVAENGSDFLSRKLVERDINTKT